MIQIPKEDAFNKVKTKLFKRLKLQKHIKLTQTSAFLAYILSL